MPPQTHAYPFAASPDIIRSHQKDAYFNAILLEQLSTILRKLYGARFVHTYTAEARTFSELLYLGLTTAIGNRTLGEEYCDIIQVEDDSLRLPSVGRRAGYIFASILVPYGLGKILPKLRRRVRAKLEANLRKLSHSHKDQLSQHSSPSNSLSYKLQSYFIANLDTLTSPSSIHALTLTTFYFTGAYYHLSKRLLHLRYIFTHEPAASEQRVGYEVLGVLLVLQMGVQAYLHLQNTVSRGRNLSIANAGSLMGSSAILGHGVEVSLNPDAYSSNNALLFESSPASSPSSSLDPTNLSKITSTPLPNTPTTDGNRAARYDLANSATMCWIEGTQQRKCTLCLEEMKDPSVTTCGHVFCWTCIGDWVREKPECPLCRQNCLGQHVLALRG
ncbi:hypothetical protein K432DRAFT_386589 [Lepidopterella palustris CBS 459.81]|uniref:RING-type E3 ubiquitin transferase n=1 Tax=Lepidopterella palustris CBS 459.81 TaxID=1314670 RepID=A0A8E2E003_9PEZI|nr:hypothetical protein K432DRAFT_386589 [Lepidopterella palustris CBS 459.81]